MIFHFKEKGMKLIRDNIIIKLEHIGEGYNGDYDEEDPNDVPLLRFTIFKDGEQLNDGSYCTTLPINTPEDRQQEVLEEIMGMVFHPLKNGQSIKKICQTLSWV